MRALAAHDRGHGDAASLGQQAGERLSEGEAFVGRAMPARCLGIAHRARLTQASLRDASQMEPLQDDTPLPVERIWGANARAAGSAAAAGVVPRGEVGAEELRKRSRWAAAAEEASSGISAQALNLSP